jgi:CubicO group peptidase (beta-lactamase class C family)
MSETTRPTNSTEPTTTPTRVARLRRRIVLLLVLASLLLAACDQSSGPKPALSRPVNGDGASGIDHAAIDRAVLDFLEQAGAYAGTYPTDEDDQTPKVRSPLEGGATVAVTRGGRLVLSKSYGWADQEAGTPMLPRHRSRIGSVSKFITTIAAFQLVETGQLDLDAPLYGDPGSVSMTGDWPPAARDEWPNPDSVLATPQMYWSAMREGAVELAGPGAAAALMHVNREWASQITPRHLLTHTSGFLRSGTTAHIEEYFGRSLKDYRSMHLGVLRGAVREEQDDDTWARVPPLRFAPGTDWRYSNHGFGLLGHIIEESSGGRLYWGYYDHVKGNILDPLGLHDVVGNNWDLDSGLDAWPHGDELDPDRPARFLSTGSWSASARDLSRLMCGIDGSSNHLRLVPVELVDELNSVPFPQSSSIRGAHGWDWTTGTELYKNGRIGGGTAGILKVLPGHFAEAPDDEINVAIAFNSSVPDGAVGLIDDLARSIAAQVAAADIDDGYDLFDPAHRCTIDGPTVTILAPSNGQTFKLGEEVFFEAEAWDATGAPLPIRWSAPVRGVDDPPTQPGPGGRHGEFHVGFTEGTHVIEVTTTDSGGNEATDQVTIEVVYDRPTAQILHPADGSTVLTGEPLDLAGQSTSGLFALPDDQVRWTVRRAGAVVHHGTGHQRTVAGNLLTPGDYRITFTVSDGTTEAEAQVDVVVEPKPLTDPTAVIHEPTGVGVELSGSEIQFSGSGIDSEGVSINGTRYRWTATRAGETTVLCDGTNTPGSTAAQGGGGAGGLLALTDCSTFTAVLYGHHPAASTTYLITLQVWDVEGNTHTAARSIQVFLPPVS